MRIIRLSELQQTAWKNGGGITREIASRRVGEALVWRLGMADVGADGPFSRFDGFQRILTVIDGHGMELISSKETLQADYAVPVSFDGTWEIQSRLKDGPLRDLNLIYDPTLCVGNAQVVVGYARNLIDAKPRQTSAVHCIKGSVALGNTEQLQKGDTALIESDAIQCAIAEHGSALLITMVLATQTTANN